MTDKPFKEPVKVGGKLDAAAPWMMAVGTLLAVAGFVLTFTLAPLVNGAAVSEPQVIAGTVVAISCSFRRRFSIGTCRWPFRVSAR